MTGATRANPGKISLASAGIGTPNHMSGELFKTMAGVDMAHVPYRGGGPAIADLLGGQVDVTFAVVTTAIEYIRAGKLRALAVTSATRSEMLPDVPTVGQFVPGYEASTWSGVGAPKPHLGHQAGGAGSRSAIGAHGIGDSTAPIAAECQSFLDNVIAQFDGV
jgi:tripartite-type tricarboxylate transporter receptor subunit TctC